MESPVNSGSGSESSADQQLAVTVERSAENVVLHVSGEIDLLTSTALGERLREHLDPANRVLVLNLTQVSFLGSAGLAEIVSAAQTGSERGARLVLVASNRAVLRPLEVTGLLTLFTVYETVHAALAAVGE